MKTIFTFKTNSRVRPFDLLVKNRNTEKFGSKSFMALGPKIWNVLPKKIKQETFFSKFKEYIKSWSGISNYGNSLVIREVYRHCGTFEKQLRK